MDFIKKHLLVLAAGLAAAWYFLMNGGSTGRRRRYRTARRYGKRFTRSFRSRRRGRRY